MKKFIFTILTILFMLPAFSQVEISGPFKFLVNSYDLSGTSANFPFYFSNFEVQDVWSIQVKWSGVTGTGTVELEVSNDNLGWISYSSGLLTTSITGASGNDGWEDDRFAWRYGRIKFTKGTLSAGVLTVTINR